MGEEVQDAEYKELEPAQSPQPPQEPVAVEAEKPVLNGQTVEQVRFLDYGNIRVVFDSKSGAVLGVMPAKKPRKNVTS